MTIRRRAAAVAAVAVCLLGGAIGPAGADTSVSATLGSASDEFALVLSPAQVPAGGVVLAATNGGSEEHTLGLKGGAETAEILPGGTETLDFGDLEAGTYTFICTIAGHEQLGMTANLTVTGRGGDDDDVGAGHEHDRRRHEHDGHHRRGQLDGGGVAERRPGDDSDWNGYESSAGDG